MGREWVWRLRMRGVLLWGDGVSIILGHERGREILLESLEYSKESLYFGIEEALV
jgi:hypothetical protein